MDTENKEFKETVGFICHKLRSPLSVISMGAQLLLADKTLSEHERQVLERMLRNTDRIAGVMDELLDSVGTPTRHSAGK